MRLRENRAPGRDLIGGSRSEGCAALSWIGTIGFDGLCDRQQLLGRDGEDPRHGPYPLISRPVRSLPEQVVTLDLDVGCQGVILLVTTIVVVLLVEKSS